MEINTVRSAYRKLKSYIYYDNSNLLLKRDLAQFESDGNIDEKLDVLTGKIQKYRKNKKFWTELMNQISSRQVVKQFRNDTQVKGVISNQSNESEFVAEKLNHFIFCPIELHICAAIWTFEVGFKLEKEVPVVPFGNKLELKKNGDEYEVAEGLKSYKPYFGQYQKWRDGAVKAAKNIVNRKSNAIVFGLDIKNFYHSVQLDFKLVHKKIFPQGIPEEWKSICYIVERIHKSYTKRFSKNDVRRVILPIGIVSSGVLANYYLSPLDEAICSKLRPEFYGRYVDDILFVSSCPDSQEVETLEEMAEHYLVQTNIFNKKDQADTYHMVEDGYENITIQTSKLSVLHFVASEPTALLDKFATEIKRNSSEYRLLPEDEVVDYDFDQAAYSLNYKGTGNKLRDIKEFGEDKFGVSKYLAKKIFLALQSGHESDKDAVEKIQRYFKNKRAVDLYPLWEKVFTFLMLNKDHLAILNVAKEIIGSINKIKYEGEEPVLFGDFYFSYLFTSISLALALQPSILDDETFITKIELALEESDFFEVYSFDDSINSFRKSNLIRHNYVVYPLLNYVGKNNKGNYYDLIDYSKYFKLSTANLRIEHEMYRFSPRFVHFHEITLFNIINRISTGKSKFYKSGVQFGSKSTGNKDYLIESAKEFYKLNFKRNHKTIGNSNRGFKEVFSQLLHLDEAKSSNNWVRTLRVSQDYSKKKIKIAIANLQINDVIFEHSYLRKPKINPMRRKQFNSILNQAELENVDMIFLPEVSVPVAWFKWIADHALRQQRAMVFGLEHWVVGKRAFNFLITLLPFEYDGYKSLTISIRLKNHYSPGEINLLESYGYIIPEVKSPSYDLFNWNGCHFTTFNCFELSNIDHRARFKSKIDLLVASEFNQDVNYFSNIVESSARDLHCYVAQVNDAKFGDSRITQPSKTFSKDLLKVKGGINPTILVDSIDLNKLREFQLKEYSGQKDLGTFKATPPEFDKNEVLKRMKD